MGKQVVRWMSDDGKEFDSQQDMLLYELGRLDEKEIDLFIDQNYSDASRRKTEYKKLLMKWQGHMRSIEGSLYITDKNEVFEEESN